MLVFGVLCVWVIFVELTAACSSSFRATALCLAVQFVTCDLLLTMKSRK